MKSFETWEFEEINNTFGTRQVWEHDLMNEWSNADYELSEAEKVQIERLRLNALKNVITWNEDELKFMVISPLISLIDFGNDKYKAFTQRRLSAKIQDVEVSGIVDFVLSSGVQIPKHPFFFIHEYKQERKRENDPLGQVLIEMLAAQTKNDSNHPIFGAYVVGRLWFFVLLQGNEYIVNYALDITRKEHLPQIVKMLFYVKKRIDEILVNY